jgi:hypothetical protein
MSDEEWDYLPHDDDVEEIEQLSAEEEALHVVDPDQPETKVLSEPPRPVRQMFPDEQRDQTPYTEKEHDIEYLLEVQHYAFPEEHAD